MFDINFESELNKIDIRNNLIKKLDKIPVKDDIYLKYISKYKSEEINPDLNLFDYEKALNGNNYLKNNFPEIAKEYWLIADTGQGDEWFMNIKNENIIFYDHNKGEYNDSGFLQMNLSFENFLKLGFLVNKLENYLDEDMDEDIIKPFFIEALNKIRKDLYNDYPYKYF
ncbi:SMI1/KNR4 family protein [Aquimarina sp. RZ0]|uniref:SMI1/KNR4 family protein n=1 Tax=Aquimarina sp. RZ0 TaxID=2607730 RepID=UPI0011F1A38E|nr:SMI1/KNR4 family protein [Aquimarina sp. RZ0]KAA1246349.1 SMI1/KNR4 family protein [Aquimarina sp. RZ0]